MKQLSQLSSPGVGDSVSVLEHQRNQEIKGTLEDEDIYQNILVRNPSPSDVVYVPTRVHVHLLVTSILKLGKYSATSNFGIRTSSASQFIFFYQHFYSIFWI